MKHPRETDTALIGRTVSHFRILEKLGSGGMGEVYRALDTKLMRSVALKRLRPALAADPSLHGRLLREARHAALVSHPGIAAVHDVIDDPNGVFVVMEFVRGQTLATAHRRKPCDLAEFFDIAIQCGEALAAAHEQGIIHCDIKPGNIMLTPSQKVKILDFGLALRSSSYDGFTTPTTSVNGDGKVAFQGTPAYMSPEALLGKELDQRADIFSLGVVFYECLTGRNPFLDETLAATAHRVLSEFPPPMVRVNPRVPEDLEAIIEKMLEKDLGTRYVAVAEILVDLRRAKRHDPSSYRFTATPSPVRSRRGSMRTKYMGTIIRLVLVLVVVVALGLLLSDSAMRLFNLAPLPERRTLAVLPISVEGGDQETQALANGIRELLSRCLSRLSYEASFNVVPTSILDQNQVKLVNQIRTEAGADLSLSATLKASPTALALSVKLFDEPGKLSLRRESVSASHPDELVTKVLIQVSNWLDPSLRKVEPVLSPYINSDGRAFRPFLMGLGYLCGTISKAGIECAVDHFETSLELSPDYAAALAEKGLAYVTLSQISGDQELLRRAGSVCGDAENANEQLVEAPLCLGNIALLKGESALALEKLSRASFLDPVNEEVLSNLSTAYWTTGEKTRGEEIWTAAADRKQDFWLMHERLAFFLAQRCGKFEAALKPLKRAAELAPNNYLILRRLGIIYARLLRWEESRIAFEKSIAIHPSGFTYTNLATAYFYQERYREAVDFAERAVTFLERETSGRRYLHYGNLAEILYWSPGERENAYELYRKALQLAAENLTTDPSDFITLGRMALYYAMLGKEQEALEALDHALELASGDPDTLFKAALVYRQFGRNQESIQWFENSLSAGYNPDEACLHPMFRELCRDPAYQKLLKAGQP